MTNKEKEPQSEKGFTVTDRRFTAKDEAEKEEILAQEKEAPKEEEAPSAKQNQQEAKPDSQQAVPEINFTGLILSLSQSALIQLGEIPDPLSHKQEKNLALAKQSIDLISLLQEKTKGNLTKEEELLLQNVLYDLKMRFVQSSK